MTDRRLSILSNNGDIGGGEVMLLQLAEAARDGGYNVTVVAPETPGACAEAAAERNFSVVRIPGTGRAAYMLGLRGWARPRTELLWCNGLVPATATALLQRPRRVVHLHRLPEGAQRILSRIARLGAVMTVVPSKFMAGRLGYGEVLPNWSPAVSAREPRRSDLSTRATVGFLGRLSPDKGIVDLADAIILLNRSHPEREVRLLLAGEPRFVSPGEQQTVERALARCEPWLDRAGWMEREDFFGRIDLLAVPSTWEEPFGLVAIEAMSAGVPLAVSRSGALPEVVGEEHPFVAERLNGRDLARVIDQMLEDPFQLRSATRAARMRWHENYSPDTGSARLRDLLENIFGSAAEKDEKGMC